MNRLQLFDAQDAELKRLRDKPGVLRCMIGTTRGEALGSFTSNMGPTDIQLEALRSLVRMHFAAQAVNPLLTTTRATVGDDAVFVESRGPVVVAAAFSAGGTYIKSAKRTVRTVSIRMERAVAKYKGASAVEVALKDCEGIAWWDNGTVVTNPTRPYIENLDEVPFAAWQHLDIYD